MNIEKKFKKKIMLDGYYSAAKMNFYPHELNCRKEKHERQEVTLLDTAASSLCCFVQVYDMIF